MFCPELLRRFWSDQSETYTGWIYMGWSWTPPRGGDVGPSVCLWEVSELRSSQHFTNPSVFFQCSLLNLSWGFSRINLKPIQIEYIWVGVVHLPLMAASHRPFFCERGRNLDLYYIDLSWLAIIYRWAIIQESCLIPRKPLLTDVLSFLDLYYIDLSWFGNYFRWAIIQESCLITRKPLLIGVLSFLVLSTYILSWLGNYFRWAIIQISCLITRKPLLIDILSFLDLYYIN